MCQGVIALSRAPRSLVPLEERDGVIQRIGRHVELFGASIEQVGSPGICPGIRHQRQIVRKIRPFSWEACPFRRQRHSIRQWNRISTSPGRKVLDRTLKPPLHLEDPPKEGRRIPPVEYKRIESIQAEMIAKPICSTLLGHGRPLIDAAAILDHDRRHQFAIFRLATNAGPNRFPAALQTRRRIRRLPTVLRAAACGHTEVRQTRDSRPPQCRRL
jgi:hypothetical protein